MIGTNTEKDFKLENYEEFYTSHNFQPMGNEDAFNVHEVIPRFGWAFDTIKEIASFKPGRAEPRKLRVLDLGCLDGSFILTLMDHQPWVDGFGVDLTQDGIEIARARALEKGLKATFEQGTIEGLLSQYAHIGLKFDVVTSFEVMEHVKDPELVLKLIDQVLAPNGTVLISTPAFESPLFGMDDEQNKCHIRLYTTQDEDYEAVNKYGTKRKATSITKQIGKARIKEIEVMSELINVRYN